MTPTRLVNLIAGSFVTCSFITACLYALEMGHLGLDHIIRLLAIIIIAWLLIKGSDLGRWIAILLMGIAGVVTLFGGLILIQESMRGVAYVLIGVCTGIGVAALSTSYAGLHFNQK